MSVTIAGTATALNRYVATFKPQINTSIRQKLVTEKMWSQRVADHTWVAPNVTSGNLIQAFQCDFTPNNTHTFDEERIPLQRMKIDVQFTCDDLDQWFDTFMVNWDEFGTGKAPSEWEFPKWIYENEIMPKYEEELELLLAYKGVRVAPTTGTAGNTADAVDGMGKKIADAITAGRIVPIATGAFSSGTYIAKFDTFINGLPVKFRDGSGNIYVSPTHARALAKEILDTYKTNPNIDPSDTMKILNFSLPFTNKRVVGLPSMEGRNRMLYSPRPDNLVVVRRRGEPMVPVIRWENFERTLKGFSEFHRGYGFEFGTETFVNDQA
mgnify:CR=1 FL=1